MRLWQVKTLSLKGKGFKGPLKGAEMSLQRRRGINSKYEVIRCGSIQFGLLARLGPNPKPRLLARLGPNPKLGLLARLGPNPKLEFLARLGPNPKLGLLARLGPNPKPANVFRGETVTKLISTLNISHPKISLHPLKRSLSFTSLINANRCGNYWCRSLRRIDALIRHLVTGITKQKGSPNSASNEST